MAGILREFATDGMGDGNFMFGQYDPNLSGEQIVLAATAVALPAATVLGKVTATGIFKPLDPAANDGTENFGGILFGRREISAAAQKGTGVVRNQGVNGHSLVYVNAVTAEERAAIEVQMAAAGIIVRY
jgi:hypothetical protein